MEKKKPALLKRHMESLHVLNSCCKKLTEIAYLFLVILILSTASCNNDADVQPENPADALPPATQTGEQTLACLINGEPFFSDRFGSGRPSGFYQFIDGAFTLGISAARDEGTGEDFVDVSIGALQIDGITEGNHPLVSESNGNYFGRYLLGGGLILETSTLDNNPGNLTITRFDDQEFIIAGTFEFTVLDNDGNEIEITEGRFDIRYTN